LVHRPGVLGPPLADDERAARLARVFLDRYGVLTRECVEREETAERWPLLVSHLQRMEMRGEARRGYFVADLSGLQFALPEAVERLRASAETVDEALTVLNAIDPANVFGGDAPEGPLSARGEAMRFARLASTHVALWRGRPVLLAEDGGQRLTTMQGAEPSLVQRALQAYLGRPNAASRVVVAAWNGEPAGDSDGQALLQALGFYRSASGMEWWSQV
jgi:ATP-dependent Lhr-like helicase